MQCDICFRTGGSALPFLCPTDVRNKLYEPRVQNVMVLVEKDVLEQQINGRLDAPRGSGPGSSRTDVDEIKAERDQIVDRTQQIMAQADALRANIEQAKEEREKLRASMARRKSEMASARSVSEPRRSSQIEETERSIKARTFRWNQNNNVTASSRTFLCGEAAQLYGLERIKRNSSGKEEFRIGGVTIVNLTTMNTATPAQISTALSHTAHLLSLTAHYLSIRLPAEIVLPHRDYPLPTIFPTQHSYKHTNISFPGTPAPSSTTSPTSSKHPEAPHLPRPRPTWITKPLPILGHEDSATHSLFLEGATLLAYNVAWLCKSQGIPVGDSSSFEDICHIGRNMYNLLLGPFPRPSASGRIPSSHNGTDVKVEEIKDAVQPNIMGRYSHGNAQSFLGSAEGTEFIRSWKLLSPLKLADRLKSMLVNEVANAEWEVLDPDAWELEDAMGDDGVVVGARQEGRRESRDLGMQSFMSMRTVMEAVEMMDGKTEGGKERKQGTSGWTKLKPRGDSEVAR